MDESDREWQRLLNAPVRIWFCLNPAHRDVVWTDDVAVCGVCALTSKMTSHRLRLVRRDERRRAVAEIAAQLRRVAAGRREYAEAMPEHAVQVLQHEGDIFEAAARIAEGNANTLAALLPSWRLTEEEGQSGSSRGGRRCGDV